MICNNFVIKYLGSGQPRNIEPVSDNPISIWQFKYVILTLYHVFPASCTSYLFNVIKHGNIKINTNL